MSDQCNHLWRYSGNKRQAAWVCSYCQALRVSEPPARDCGGKPNYVEVGQVVQAFGDMVVIEMPEMPPVGTKLYVATDDMTRKRD